MTSFIGVILLILKFIIVIIVIQAVLRTYKNQDTLIEIKNRINELESKINK